MPGKRLLTRLAGAEELLLFLQGQKGWGRKAGRAVLGTPLCQACLRGLECAAGGSLDSAKQPLPWPAILPRAVGLLPGTQASSQFIRKTNWT